MKILAMETSTAVGSVAVSIDGRLITSKSSPNPRKHSEFINQAISECLAESKLTLADFDCFSASRGPGSFTGIRVAANVAKSFCSVFGKKMIAPDSLWLLHQGAQRQLQSPNLKSLCIINAYKNLLYTAIFNGTKVLLEPSVHSISSVENLLSDDMVILGDGFEAYKSVWSDRFIRPENRIPNVSDFPSATTLALESEDLFKSGQTIEWNSYLPLYLRASEAEENLRVK